MRIVFVTLFLGLTAGEGPIELAVEGPVARIELAFDGAVVDDLLLDAEDGHTIVRLLCSGVPDSAEWSAHFVKLRGAAERALARLKALAEQRETQMAMGVKPA